MERGAKEMNKSITPSILFWCGWFILATWFGQMLFEEFNRMKIAIPVMLFILISLPFHFYKKKEVQE